LHRATELIHARTVRRTQKQIVSSLHQRPARQDGRDEIHQTLVGQAKPGALVS